MTMAINRGVNLGGPKTSALEYPADSAMNGFRPSTPSRAIVTFKPAMVVLFRAMLAGELAI